MPCACERCSITPKPLVSLPSRPPRPSFASPIGSPPSSGIPTALRRSPPNAPRPKSTSSSFRLPIANCGSTAKPRRKRRTAVHKINPRARQNGPIKAALASPQKTTRSPRFPSTALPIVSSHPTFPLTRIRSSSRRVLKNQKSCWRLSTCRPGPPEASAMASTFC
jgi:hypothetical protein